MPNPEDFFGGQTKDEVIEALMNHSECLMNIHLAQPVTPLTQAIKDFRRERVLFNEVPFIPDKADHSRNVGFALTLNEYLRRTRERFPTGVDNSQSSHARGRSVSVFTERDNEANNGRRVKDLENEAASSRNELLNLDYMTSAEIILQRSCRSSAGTDSFFMIQKLFCAEGTLVTQRSNILGFVPFINGEPPVVIDVYLDDGNFTSRNRECQDDDCDIAEKDLEVSGTEDTAVMTEGVDDSKVPPASIINKGVGTISGITENNERCPPQLVGDIRICNSFAVYDVDAVDLISGDADTDPPPWLEVETVITDKCNFATGEQRRVLEIQVYCPSLNLYFPPLEARKRNSRVLE